MRTEFSQFVNLPYKFSNGPNVLIQDSVMKEGVNCQSLVHLIFNSFGITLPPNMLSKEIYEDTQLFTMVEETGRLKLLDVFLFGKENEQDFKKLHLAIHTGEHDELGNPLLIHANGIQKRVSVWPLKQFLSYPQYKKSMP